MATKKKMERLTPKKGKAETLAGHNIPWPINVPTEAVLNVWAQAEELDPLEKLGARWHLDAAVLRRNGQGQLADILESHSEELRRATQEFLRRRK